MDYYMKCMILAGGTGSRLGGITKGINKHLLPVSREPMIAHQVKFVSDIGFKSTLLVTNAEYVGDFVRTFQNFDIDIHIYYVVQRQPQGIADAIKLLQPINNQQESTFVLLGDNLYSKDDYDSFKSAINDQINGCHIWLKQVADPKAYGVLTFDGDIPVKIEEKPLVTDSPWAVTGVYAFDSQLWDILPTLQPSARGEYEITDVIKWYLERQLLTIHVLRGQWDDLGHNLEDYYKRAAQL